MLVAQRPMRCIPVVPALRAHCVSRLAGLLTRGLASLPSRPRTLRAPGSASLLPRFTGAPGDPTAGLGLGACPWQGACCACQWHTSRPHAAQAHSV